MFLLNILMIMSKDDHEDQRNWNALYLSASVLIRLKY